MYFFLHSGFSKKFPMIISLNASPVQLDLFPSPQTANVVHTGFSLPFVFPLSVNFLFATFSTFSSGCGIPPRSHLMSWSHHFPAAGNSSCWWLTDISIMECASTPGNCLTHGYSPFQWVSNVVTRGLALSLNLG